jgi:phage-related protein
VAASGVLVGRGYVSIRPEFEGDWSRSVNTRASSAGKSGAGAFSKAFGVGLKGIGALAGVAVAANLSSAAAGAAALAPALTTAGAAAGALKIGMSGVGAAFKAAFADSTGQASSAASATRAVESAQRGLANAQRALADARVQAAERVREANRAVEDAERSLARTVEESAQRQQDAQRQVKEAERDLADAQREATKVQSSLNEARQQAARDLEDLNNKLSQSRLDEREATRKLADAEAALKAAEEKPGNALKDIEALRLARDQAALDLKEQQGETKRLAQDSDAANKAGIDGSKKVKDAQDRIADSQRNVADKSRALARAQEDARRAGVDGARAVADAQRALAEAQAGVAKAHADGARQIEDAQRGVADAAAAVADAQAAAAAQTSAADAAMAKLAPNAQAFVRAVKGLAPAWDAMRLSVQNELFKGLDDTVTTLGRATIPILQRQLTATAGVWNTIGKNAAGAVTEMAKSGMLDKILAGATANLKVFEKTPGQIITAFGQLSVAAQPAFNSLLTQFAGAITSFTDGLSKSFASGGLEQAINTAFGILSQFGTLLGNVLGTVSQIFKAASDAGGSIVGALSAVFAELKQILAAPEMQATLKSLFQSVAQIIAAIVPVIGTIVKAVVPLMAAIAGPIAQLATVLGPVLQQLATALGAALMPIIQALMPVLVQVGAAIIQIVQAVTPLLKPIADLISGVITALAPALTPVISLITMLTDALVGPLSQVVKALTPIFIQLGGVISQIFAAIQPFLAPLVDMIGEVAGLVAGVMAQAFKQLMSALGPLIPVGIQLIQDVFSALTPVLPVLVDAFSEIAKAALSLIGPIGGIVAELGKSLAPVIADLAPVIAQIAMLFAGALADAIPPLAAAIVTLVGALNPLWPLIGQLIGQVVKLAAGLLVQLLPTFIQLALAIVPLIPSLAKIAAIVLELAVKVLSWLLPPLIQLAGFLIGVFAGALKVAISWIANIVKWISTLVSWVVDKTGPAMTWLRDKVIKPVWSGIKAAISLAWTGIKNVFGWIKSGVSALGDVFRWLYNKAIKPAWNGIKSAISFVYEKGIKPIFSALKSAVKAVSDSFDTARKAIKTAWDKLKGIAKGPVNFIIDIVYNKGIRGVWNKIAGAFGAPKLDKFQFAQGGVLPGYTPGRDPHKFYSPTGGALEMSGGEAIMRPEFTRGVGPGFVSYFNHLAKSGGAGRVREALAPVLGGNDQRSPTDRSLRYKDGGIFGWIGSAASSVAGAGSAAWNGIKKGASWLADTLEASARAGVKNVVDPLLRSFPGMDTGIGKMLRHIPTKIIDALFGYSKDADKKGGGGVGGPKIQKALKWAKTQNGKKYQWAGNGNPSWDCSGFMSAIESVIRGQKPHRRWATGAFSGKTAPPGWVLHGNSPFKIGITNKGVGHTAGTIAKTNVESRGGDGVVVGKRARSYKDSLFTSWYGFEPGKYDSGGWLQPGLTAAVNNTGRPEAILTAHQWDAVSSRAADGGGPSYAYTINARTADFTVADLQRVQRVQEARARVGRPR